jgi:hypothetical protein
MSEANKQGLTERVSEEKGLYSHEQIEKSNLDIQKSLPDLSKSKKHFVPLTIEYWTPEKEGEEKLVYVHSVGFHEVPDMDTGELKQLECVMLLENQGGVVKRFINAGQVLVGNIKDAIGRNEIVPGTTLTPLSITYIGKKQNKSNSRISNIWQIIPLIPENQHAN